MSLDSVSPKAVVCWGWEGPGQRAEVQPTGSESSLCVHDRGRVSERPEPLDRALSASRLPRLIRSKSHVSVSAGTAHPVSGGPLQLLLGRASQKPGCEQDSSLCLSQPAPLAWS